MSSVVLDSSASYFAVKILPLTRNVIPPHTLLHIAIEKKAFLSLLYRYNFTLFLYAILYITLERCGQRKCYFGMHAYQHITGVL